MNDLKCVRPMRSAVSAALAVLLASSGACLGQEASRTKTDPDWPCRQILVETISAPAVWNGPSIEGVKWRADPAVADLVPKLAARRTPIEDAERAIDEFAKSRSADKGSELTALFVGLFETLNGERAQVIDGLRRFGRKQKELAAKIRAENAEVQSSAAAPRTNETPDGQNSKAEVLALDLRLFDERRQALAYVCETPTLIEQRLFALARAIQRNLN